MNNPWTRAYDHPNFVGYTKEQIDEMLMCELEEIYNYEFTKFSAYAFKWIDNQTISFTKGSEEGRYEETIKHNNGLWQLSTDE